MLLLSLSRCKDIPSLEYGAHAQCSSPSKAAGLVEAKTFRLINCPTFFSFNASTFSRTVNCLNFFSCYRIDYYSSKLSKSILSGEQETLILTNCTRLIWQVFLNTRISPSFLSFIYNWSTMENFSFFELPFHTFLQLPYYNIFFFQ